MLMLIKDVRKKIGENIFSKIFLSNIEEHDVKSSKYRFNHFCLRSVCLNIFGEFFSMYARPIQIQTKVHLKILPILIVTYDMGYLRCAM